MWCPVVPPNAFQPSDAFITDALRGHESGVRIIGNVQMRHYFAVPLAIACGELLARLPLPKMLDLDCPTSVVETFAIFRSGGDTKL
jgi:hypothetical protein